VFSVLLLVNQRGVRVTKMTMTHGEDETSEDVVVLTGEHNGLDWKVVATWGPRPDPVEGRELMTMLQGFNGRELMTMLHGFKGTKRVIGSGFGGPALYPGQLVHEWRGRTDQWPYFVMARADPTVDRIVAVTDRGTEVELSLSAVVPQFGLRFAAAGLPTGEAPNRLIIEVRGETVADLHRPMH
jgi:hypothetical protein